MASWPISTTNAGFSDSTSPTDWNDKMPAYKFSPKLGIDARRRELLVLGVAAPLACAGSLFAAGPEKLPLAAVAGTPRLATPHTVAGYHRSAHIETYYASLRY